MIIQKYMCQIINHENWLILFFNPVDTQNNAINFAGADTGFRKGGGGVQVTVLKRSLFAHTHATFFFPLYEVWGSPKRGAGGS